MSKFCFDVSGQHCGEGAQEKVKKKRKKTVELKEIKSISKYWSAE